MYFEHLSVFTMLKGCYAVLTVVMMLVWSVVTSKCPNSVKNSAFQSFETYQYHLLNVRISKQTLFSGVDVEVLRGFCESYNAAISSIQQLHSRCPDSVIPEIEQTISSLLAAREELRHLCKDDFLYELYSRNRNCIAQQGHYSETCYKNIMNTTVELSSKLNEVSLNKLCSNMKTLIGCIRDNVLRHCNQEAAGLMETLIKPTVERSSQCDYQLVTSSVAPNNNRMSGNKRTGSTSYTQSEDPENSSAYFYPQISIFLVTLVLTLVHSSHALL